jgi:hypothetical protein
MAKKSQRSGSRQRLGPGPDFWKDYRKDLEQTMDEIVVQVEKSSEMEAPVVIKAVDGEARCTVCWTRESEWNEFHGYTRCA